MAPVLLRLGPHQTRPRATFPPVTVAPTELRYEEADHVGVVTLDRPQARNALTFTTYAELESVVRTTTARCLVITGADPAFCSGDDVKQVMLAAGSGTADRLETTPRLTPAADALLHTDVPVIAAVNGAAVGWGMELALMADIRVASERARFGELFVKRGLCCDAPGLGRLAQAVGRERAAELLFTGRLVDAQEAASIGLVSRVVPHDELLPAALELAGAIAANPPLAVQRMKAGLRRALDPDWRELGSWVSATLGELFRTADHREGVAAFLERREALFTGR
jgi:enoyl-CoA hydratase/carnithine racemase